MRAHRLQVPSDSVLCHIILIIGAKSDNKLNTKLSIKDIISYYLFTDRHDSCAKFFLSRLVYFSNLRVNLRNFQLHKSYQAFMLKMNNVRTTKSYSTKQNNKNKSTMIHLYRSNTLSIYHFIWIRYDTSYVMSQDFADRFVTRTKK